MQNVNCLSTEFFDAYWGFLGDFYLIVTNMRLAFQCIAEKKQQLISAFFFLIGILSYTP